jgi:hypothetical protein
MNNAVYNIYMKSNETNNHMENNITECEKFIDELHEL